MRKRYSICPVRGHGGRGSRFAQALELLGVPTWFQTYPSVGDSFVPDMRTDTIRWFLGS